MQDFKEGKDLVKVIGKRKVKDAFYVFGMGLPILTFFSFLGILMKSNQSSSLAIASMGGHFSLFTRVFEARKKYRKETAKKLEELSKDIAELVGDPNWRVYKLDDIVIIPRNIKVAENLESLNIVPIYKKGEFIIMRGNYSLEILAQYKEDGKVVVKILDDDEVKEELDNFGDGMKRIILRNKGKEALMLGEKKDNN